VFGLIIDGFVLPIQGKNCIKITTSSLLSVIARDAEPPSIGHLDDGMEIAEFG
jgi:hypothetical protein